MKVVKTAQFTPPLDPNIDMIRDKARWISHWLELTMDDSETDGLKAYEAALLEVEPRSWMKRLMPPRRRFSSAWRAWTARAGIPNGAT
jgi:hypothetical protein